MTPYRALSEYLRERYQARTYRLTVAGGRTCPTRDGTFGPKKGWGGCTFCDVQGSASYHADVSKHLSVREQLENAVQGVKKRFNAEKFIAYFQSYTTSHQEIEQFRDYYREVRNFPDVVALAVATRPDCLHEDFLRMVLEELHHHDVILELGVQTFHDPSLDWYDRGHDAETARVAIRRALELAKEVQASGAKGKFDLVAHLIIGSPLESEADLLRNAEELNALGVQGVKIHNLHVLKKTKLARTYAQNKFHLPELEEYNQKLALFLRHLSPEIVVHRTSAAASRLEDLIAPAWTISGAYPNSRLRYLMQTNGWQQGDLLPNSPRENLGRSQALPA